MFTTVNARYFGQPLAYRESTEFPGKIWFVASLKSSGESHEYLGQIEEHEGVFHSYAYPTLEAVFEGAQDALIGEEASLKEAAELFAASDVV
jgi:hypothetical protein